MEDNRQKLLDQLGSIVGQLFTDGLNESPDVVKKSVMDGLGSNRVRISVSITLPPLAISFGIADQTGETAVTLFEIVDTKARPLLVDDRPPGADVVN